MYNIVENAEILKNVAREFRKFITEKLDIDVQETEEFKNALNFDFLQEIKDFVEIEKEKAYNKGYVDAFRVFMENYIDPCDTESWEEIEKKITNEEKMKIAKSVEEAFSKGLEQGRKGFKEYKERAIDIVFKPKDTVFYIKDDKVKSGTVFSVIIRDKMFYEVLEEGTLYKITLSENDLFFTKEEALEYIEMEKE